ncbi:FAD-dependent oxidoreductase [Opitutaceae bacterium TAV4]|nr:FAD-dependent oxidoreductase [Opitutaceae bacterium TAV4]RRJ98808.1 FAD-dependent oxidoreductase [Opitutaceae bacterium TAV3]
MKNQGKQTPRIFVEPARELSVLDEADVLVLGAGPGGVAASIAAARNGASVILVERFGLIGGTWTSGHLGAIMPFPFVRGLFKEFSNRLRDAGGWFSRNENYGAGATYDIEVAKIVLDRFVTEAGVRPYFFAQVAGVFREGNRISGVVIESKEGRHVLTGRMVIDATGDGDVSVLAGVPFAQGRDSDQGCQPMSMIFTMDGADDARAEISKKEDPGFTRAWKAAKARGEITVPREDVLAFNMPRSGQWSFNVTRIINRDATKLGDVTAAMLEGRRQVAEVSAFLRKRVPGFENAYLSGMAPHIGVRESRRIACGYTLTADDVIRVPEFADCIARGNWFIDIHNPSGEGTVRIHPPAGRWYEIPYRSICAQGVDNLLVASRCIDCTHEAHAAIRITPQVMAIGQGAGTAAALCVKRGLSSTRDLDAALLRQTLREQGAFV